MSRQSTGDMAATINLAGKVALITGDLVSTRVIVKNTNFACLYRIVFSTIVYNFDQNSPAKGAFLTVVCVV